jgi:hypothetical protein
MNAAVTARHRVEVYDRRNPERLLGTLPRPDVPANGGPISVAVMPRFSPFYDEPLRPLAPAHYAHKVLHFQPDKRYSEGGWKIDVAVTTDAPLDDLMRLQDFRLPGEDARAARMRRDFA